MRLETNMIAEQIWKKEKKSYVWVFTFEEYGKYSRILLCHFIKHKLLFFWKISRYIFSFSDFYKFSPQQQVNLINPVVNQRKMAIIPTWSICQKVWPASTCHLEGKFPTPILHNQKNFWEIKQQWMNQWTICLKKVKVLLHKKGLQKVHFFFILYCMFLSTLSPDLR